MHEAVSCLGRDATVSTGCPRYDTPTSFIYPIHYPHYLSPSIVADSISHIYPTSFPISDPSHIPTPTSNTLTGQPRRPRFLIVGMSANSDAQSRQEVLEAGDVTRPTHIRTFSHPCTLSHPLNTLVTAPHLHLILTSSSLPRGAGNRADV